MRLLLDANLASRRIGEPLRAHGHDVRGVADEPELEGLVDDALLEFAAREERVLVTRNSRDFTPICRTWAEAGRDQAGVILIWTLAHRQHGEIIRALERRLDALPDAAGWRGAVVGI